MNHYNKSIDCPGRIQSVQRISYKGLIQLASSYSIHFYAMNKNLVVFEVNLDWFGQGTLTEGEGSVPLTSSEG
jgi:hypothetical protein